MLAKRYNYVLFHNPCLDGFLSFCVLRHAGLLTDKPFIRGVGPDIKTVPPRIKGRDVIISDLNLDKALLSNICELANSVLFIDHHQSSFFVNDMKQRYPNLEVIHNCKSSASKIIFDEFIKKLDRRRRMPDVIKYINDNDLMLNEHEDTPYFITAFEVRYNNEKFGISPKGFNAKADLISPLLTSNKETRKLINLGKHYNEYKHVVTKKSLNNFEIVNIKNQSGGTWRCVITNVGGFSSKLVASQMQQFDNVNCSIVWYYNVSSKGIRCICRSKGDSNDITWLCNRYGGSGHRNAGSFLYRSTNIYDWLRHHNTD
jgi:nanoRNase/pAp phosphatase (c-di-AMP/oligoRNAs hydrolase)